MEIAIIGTIILLAVLGYSFRVDQWDMWKDPKWKTIIKEEVTGQLSNSFTSTNKKGILTVKVSTTLKKKKFKCFFYDGKNYWNITPEFAYLNLVEIREILEQNGFEL